MPTTRRETTKIKKVMMEKDSNAYRIGHKDGYDEIISKMHDILGKCYNTGYKDAMDFVCEWLYIYYPTIERCKSAEEAWKHLEKAMKEHLKKEME